MKRKFWGFTNLILLTILFYTSAYASLPGPVDAFNIVLRKNFNQQVVSNCSSSDVNGPTYMCEDMELLITNTFSTVESSDFPLNVAMESLNVTYYYNILRFELQVRDQTANPVQTEFYPNTSSAYPFQFKFQNLGDQKVYLRAEIDGDNDGVFTPFGNGNTWLPGYDFYFYCCTNGSSYDGAPVEVLTHPSMDFTVENESCQGDEICLNSSADELDLDVLNYYYMVSTDGTWQNGISYDLCDNGSCTNPYCLNLTQGYHTVYLLTGTEDGNDMCYSKKEVLVTNPLQAQISEPSLLVCEQALSAVEFVTTIGGVSPLDYEWQVASGISASGSNANIDLNVVEDGMYSVTVTDDYGCSKTLEYEVTANSCCQYEQLNSFDKASASTCPIVIPNGDGTFSFDPIFSGLPIYLNNSFTVDVPLVIRDFPDIQLGEGTVIKVTEGNTLVLDNSVLQGCGSLWYGIQINEAGLDCPTCADYDYNGASVIMRNGATIRDAGFGIESKNGSYYDIDGGNFIDNYMGIAVYDCCNFQGKVINSTFTANNQFLAPPLETLPPSIGIFAASVDGIEVGDATGNFNTFSNIVNGINSIASDMTVHPNMFHDLVESPDPDAEAFSSTGICAWNIFNHYVPTGSITVTGFSNDPDNNTVVNFENMERGIVLQAVDADINGNSFYLTKEIGIWAAECNNARVDMSNNRIQNAGTGIGYVTSNNVHGWVMNNRILYDNTLIPGVTGIGNRGLSVDQFNQQPLELVIAANEFQNYSRNIDLLNTGNDIYILQNQFTVKHFGNAIQAGVRAIDCNSPVIANNVFIGNTMATPNTNNPRSMAISLRNTQESQIECNEMDMTTYGMQFQQDCSTPGNPYAIRGNVFHHHWAGVEFSEFQSVHASVGDPFLNNGAIGDETNSNGNNFINGSSGYTSTYHTFTRTNFDQVDPGIIYTTTNDGAYNDQTTSFNWGNNWNAGTFLRTFDLSFLSHTRYQGCQNPIGGFAEGGGGEESRSMELIAAEEIATGEAFEQIPVDYKPVVQYEGEKRTFKKIDEEPSLADESYVLEDFYTEKETQAVGRMQRVRDAIKELADTIIVNDTLLYQTKLDRVRELKDEVSTTTNYEFNEKRLAEVYANTIAAGTPLYKDLDAKNFINWLAHQCVAQEGHAVYEARALYATINPNEDYDDDVLCAVAFKKEQEKVEEQQPETITMRLLPNPANAFVTLYYHLAEHDKAVFAVYNNLGEVVYETPLNANYFTQTVLTTGFVAGVYTYQVVLNGQAVKRDKFIVAH